MNTSKYYQLIKVVKEIKKTFAELSNHEKRVIKDYIYSIEQHPYLNDCLWEYLIGDRELIRGELKFTLT